MNIVIIGQNEEASINSMLASLIKYFPNDKRIWVLDRSKDDSKKILKSKGEFFVCTPNKWNGRKVSSTRNLGLKHCDNNEDVLFLDGDRFFTKCENTNFKSFKTDIVLLLVEDDERDDPKWFTKYNQIYGHLHNGFYSCGLFIKRNAINKILSFQGMLFDTSIEKYWGVEDVHLGDVCYHLKLTACIHDSARLNGHFDKDKKIPLDAWRARVKKRLPLNVIW